MIGISAYKTRLYQLVRGFWLGGAVGLAAALLIGLGARPGYAAPLPARHPQSARPDTLQAREELQQAHYAMLTDTSQARRSTRNALLLSRRAGFPEGIAVAYRLLGRLADMRGRHGEATGLFGRSERLLQALVRAHPTKHRYANLAQTANSLAVSEQAQGNLRASIVAALRAARYAEQAQNYDEQMLIYSNISRYFYDLENHAKRMHYLRLSIALRTKPLHFPERLLAPYTDMAWVLIEQHRLPEAWRYLVQARQLLALPHANQFYTQYQRVLGIYYFEAGQFGRSQAVFRQALAAAQKTPYVLQVASLEHSLGRATLALGHVAEARAQLVHSLGLSRRLHSQVGEVQTLGLLAELEEAQGAARAPVALRYLKQQQAVQEQLNDQDNKQIISKLETQYRTREQQQQIRLLRSQRQVQQQALHRKTLLGYAALGLAGLLLCALTTAYTTLRAHRKLAAQQQQLQALQLAELERERQHVATEAMLLGQDAERSRLARDLHDGLGGMLATVKHYLGTAGKTQELPAASTPLFSRALLHLDSSIGELRRVSNDMMPEALHYFGLVPALQDLCDKLNDCHPLHVQLQVYGLAERLAPRIEIVVYRLVQELLNNALKHANARHIIVQLTCHNSRVQLVVEDDGRGFTPAPTRSGRGLSNIQARTAYLRGTLAWQSEPGLGTTATIEFPFADG